MDLDAFGKSMTRYFGPIKQALTPLLPGETHTFIHHPAELSDIPGMHHVQAAGVTITTSTDPREVTFDGEVRGQTPIYVHVADKRLRVRVPDQVGTT
jgi:diacylglycerol kinase (ATP)